jgi:hypothetical protein
MLSAILSIPFVMIFEFIIMEVLSRPTAAPLASTQPSVATSDSQELTNGSADKTPDDDVEKATVELKELASGLYEHFRGITIKERKELEALWGLTYLQLETYLQSTHSLSSAQESSNSVGKPPRHGKNSIRPSSVVDGDDDEQSDEVAVVSRGRPSMLRRTINALSSREKISVFQNVLRDIIAMHKNVEEESLKLVTLSHEEQGIRLLVLFQKDLLSGVTGEIAEKKSMQGKHMDLKPVSKGAKVCGFVFILLLDMALVFYIFLFAVNQDQSRQSAWVQSFLIWLALEIFLVSSLVMIMSEFVVPSLVFSEVKKIKAKMIETVYDYQSKVLNGDASDRVNSSDTPFNAAPYLFTSTRLAM